MRDEEVCGNEMERIDRDATIRRFSLRTLCAQDVTYNHDGVRDKGVSQAVLRDDYFPISRYFCFC